MNIRRIRAQTLVGSLVACVAAISFAPGSVHAEQQVDTAVVAFVHGLGQTGASWYPLSFDLAARHPLFPYRPTLPQDRPYSEQAGSLANHLAGFDSIAAISHSNGGVVVREYVRGTGSPRLNRHLSLGTPHRGARLAQSLQQGTVLYGLALLEFDVLETLYYFREEDEDWPFLNVGGIPAYYAEDIAFNLLELLLGGEVMLGLTQIGYLTGGWNWYPAVLSEMWPNSATFANLNSPQALAAEAAKVPAARVSISTQYPFELAPWRVAFIGVPPNYQNYFTLEAYYAWLELLFFCNSAYWYYVDHPDFQLRMNAWRWEEMSNSLAAIPGLWQAWIGGSFGESDGIVPWASSDYPAGTQAYTVPCSQFCIHHTEQLFDIDADNPYRLAIDQAVEIDLDIVDPPPPPPPPDPLVVSIDGPTEVPPAQLCSWEAIVTGGEDPYEYSWSGVLSGSSSWVSGNVSQSGWLYLTVASGPLQEDTQLYITVSPSAPPCPFD